MFFNTKKKVAKDIVRMAQLQGVSSLLPLMKDDPSIRNWLVRDQNDINDWSLLATVALSFLSLNARGAIGTQDKLFINVIVNLKEWNNVTGDIMKDLLAFVSEYKKDNVSAIAATGIWLIWNVKQDAPTSTEMSYGATVGTYLNTLAAFTFK